MFYSVGPNYFFRLAKTTFVRNFATYSMYMYFRSPYKVDNILAFVRQTDLYSYQHIFKMNNLQFTDLNAFKQGGGGGRKACE